MFRGRRRPGRCSPTPARPVWAADLRSPAFATRTAAAEALEKLGPAALPALAAAAAGPDPEAAHRAADLIARVTRRLTAGRLLAPTAVTLPVPRPLTAEALFDAVSRQTGYVIDHPPADGAGVATGRPADRLGGGATRVRRGRAGGDQRRPPRPPPAAGVGERPRSSTKVLANLEVSRRDRPSSAGRPTGWTLPGLAISRGRRPGTEQSQAGGRPTAGWPTTSTPWCGTAGSGPPGGRWPG